MRDNDVVLVLTNAPNLALAKHIAHTLVKEGLAVCVSLGAVMLSVYIWNARLEESQEIPLCIKTTQARQQAVQQKLAQLHPYDTPEILVVPISGGSARYVHWVRE